MSKRRFEPRAVLPFVGSTYFLCLFAGSHLRYFSDITNGIYIVPPLFWYELTETRTPAPPTARRLCGIHLLLADSSLAFLTDEHDIGRIGSAPYFLGY